MKITNNHGISLPLAVWLLHDEYDYITGVENYLSATTLLKSVKQIVLSRRVAQADLAMDLSDLIAQRFGHATHDSIERAWTKAGASGLKRLGYPDKVVDNLVVNPDTLKPGQVPVYIEQRAMKAIAGHTIGGKFDMVLDGRLFDFKTTSVYSWILGSKDEDYQLQGSIYRWLNPEIIRDDYVYIQFLFTDWAKREARKNPNYPQTRIKEHPVELLSVQDTEAWIQNKLGVLSRLWTAPEDELPECSDKELWRSPTVYKYYANPLKTDRATKNFETDKAAAMAFQASQGGKGIVKAIPGQVKACEYCRAFSVCQQKDRYLDD